MNLFIVFMLVAASISSVAGAVLDRSRYCIFTCPQDTTLGAWTSSLSTLDLQCTYQSAGAAGSSCIYSKTDGTLSASDSSSGCAQQASSTCDCEYVCPGVAGMAHKLVSGLVNADEPTALVCKYDNGQSCSYSTLSGGRQTEHSSFCPRTAGSTCRAQSTTFAGEDDAQAAMRRRFRTQAQLSRRGA